MKALTDALRDRRTRVALEADFREYYSLSIKGIREGEGEVSFLEASRLLTQLPRESRLFKLVSEDPLSYEDHMMMSLIDSMRVTAYFSMVNAGGQVPKKEWGKVVKGMPQPLPRPGDKAKERPVLKARARDAKNAVQNIIRNSMARAMVR